MDFITALTFLTEGDEWLNEVELIDWIWDEVEPLCNARTVYTDDTGTSLWDWLYDGSYDASETPEDIAQEWDDLTNQYRR